MNNEMVVKKVDTSLRALSLNYNSTSAAVNEAARSVKKFSQILFEIACDCYLKENNILPGSMRTKRLRKKRRTRVLGWFSDQLEKEI